MKVFIVSAMLIAAAIAAPGIMDNEVQSEDGFTRMAKIMGHCADTGDLTTCLAVKGITALNRATRSNNIEIIPGITFARDSTVSVRSGKAISENEIAASLPTDSQEKTGRLIDLAMQSAADFMNSHNLQVKLPAETTQEVARAIEEGRGKMKKFMGPLIMAIGAKLVAIIPILLGGLILLATKALIVAKVAFFLAAGLGLSKLLSGGSSLNALGKFAGGLTGGQGWGASNNGWASGGANQGWSSGSAGGSYPYARSMDGQDLAYSAQVPST